MVVLPHVLAGLRRAGGPGELRGACDAATLAARHIPVLWQLMMDGPMSVSEIAHRFEASLSAASLLVAELNAAGLVKRHPDPDDRRRTIVSVPTPVREQLKPWFDRKIAVFQRALDRLTTEQRAGLLTGLAILGDELHAPTE